LAFILSYIFNHINSYKLDILIKNMCNHDIGPVEAWAAVRTMTDPRQFKFSSKSKPEAALFVFTHERGEIAITRDSIMTEPDGSFRLGEGIGSDLFLSFQAGFFREPTLPGEVTDSPLNRAAYDVGYRTNMKYDN
jgi:hypothetical protein